ncbi:MAG TPA: tetratricopeptide repeat protein [Allosphingosinicella sp.]|jgi:cytochrome c-type biogenesis protein CcmH/NrfG|uniref:tetratricopeptide repeat protein n=1 Tax=Allosphingosinicella sp. TaxID=2823234 RepID=UPI002F2A7E63
MGWLLILILAAIVLIGLWKLGRFDRAALQVLGAALLVAMAGYAWQGSPGLSGKPVPPPVRKALPDSAFADTREDMLGRFDSASAWLTMAESYQREGDTRGGAEIIQSALKKSPNDPDLWVGLGNALVIHGGGMMTPSAELAFQRAAKIAPEHPGPKFFFGLALAQGGKFDEAERLWRGLLQTAPATVSWRPMVEERLAMLGQARAASAAGMAVPGIQQP